MEFNYKNFQETSPTRLEQHEKAQIEFAKIFKGHQKSLKKKKKRHRCP